MAKMSLPPFDWSREREEYVNDGSVETTVNIVAFYRSLTLVYSHPISRRRQREIDREYEAARARDWR